MKSAAAIARITSFWTGGAAGDERILRVGITSGIAAAEPANKHDEATAAFLHQSLESLVAYREDMTVGPLLAERIDAVSSRVAGYQTFAMAIPRFRGVSIHGTMRTAVAPSPGPEG